MPQFFLPAPEEAAAPKPALRRFVEDAGKFVRQSTDLLQTQQLDF